MSDSVLKFWHAVAALFQPKVLAQVAVASPEVLGASLASVLLEDPVPPLIVGLGGGVNSTALLVGLYERGVRPDLISFADTGSEKPDTYRHIKDLDAWLLSVGFPAVTVVRKGGRTGDTSIEDECLRRETLPSRAFGLSSCALRWKAEPQEKFLNHWPPALRCWAKGGRPVKMLGIDAGEAHRAKITSDSKLRFVYPLVEWDWDRSDCVAAIKRAGMSVPLKSACFFCPSSTKPEVIEMAKTHPDLMDRALRVEAVALESKKHDLRSVFGLGRKWAWRDLLKTSNTEEFVSAPVESCGFCYDGSPSEDDSEPL